MLVLVLCTGTTRVELEPARIRIACCRRAIMRSAGYPAVDLAFTGVPVMLISGSRRLLRLCRWRVPIWIDALSYGWYSLHIPARRFTHRVARALSRESPPRGSAEVFWRSRPRFRGPGFRGRSSSGGL